MWVPSCFSKSSMAWELRAELRKAWFLILCSWLSSFHLGWPINELVLLLCLKNLNYWSGFKILRELFGCVWQWHGDSAGDMNDSQLQIYQNISLKRFYHFEIKFKHTMHKNTERPEKAKCDVLCSRKILQICKF